MSFSLEVSSVGKSYGDFRALEGVSFSIRPGEILGLIGPNGAGKTTLFECLAGVLPSSSGSLLHDGVRVDANARRSLLFYMPDAIAPWPARTVGWALDYVVGFFGGVASLREGVIREMAIEPLLRVPMGALSKGQRKRALLAMGLLTSQPVLMVDEPFDGLDLRQSRETAAALRTHASRGRTLFLSIHQISDAARLCDRFVLLSGGQVRGEGTLEELKASARSRAAAAAAPAPADLEEVFLALT